MLCIRYAVWSEMQPLIDAYQQKVNAVIRCTLFKSIALNTFGFL